MFKPNTIIALAYDSKKNKVYKIDVTSKKIYSSFSNFNVVNSNMFAVIMVVFVGAFRRFLAEIRPDLYLNETSQHLKILLMLIGVLIGLIIFILVQKKRYGLRLDKYLQQFPPPEEMHDVEEVLDKAHSASMLMVVLSIGFLIGSIYMCIQFFSDGNLTSYFWTLIWLMYFSGFSALLKSAKITFKLISDIKLKENEVSKLESKMNLSNEPSIPKKHPWEEKKDENEDWKAKMLKIESEMNANKK